MTQGSYFQIAIRMGQRYEVTFKLKNEERIIFLRRKHNLLVLDKTLQEIIMKNAVTITFSSPTGNVVDVLQQRFYC